MAVSEHTQTLPSPQSAIERRRFLMMAGGLAAATAAAGAVAVRAARAAPAVPENPELVRLGEQLAAIAAEYSDAIAARRAIVQEWEPHWPAAPEVLYTGYDWGDKVERGLTGAAVLHGGRQRRIYTSATIRGWIDTARRALRRKDIDKRRYDGRLRPEWEVALAEWKTMLPSAERYEAEKDRIQEASGYSAADAREQAAEKEFLDLVHAITEEPATTMQGVVIKARAIEAWGDTPIGKHIEDVACRASWQPLCAAWWGCMLASTIARLPAAEAAS